MILSPCKDCEERHIGCHSICKEYIKFSIDSNKEKDIINKAKKRQYICYDERKHKKHM